MTATQKWYRIRPSPEKAGGALTEDHHPKDVVVDNCMSWRTRLRLCRALVILFSNQTRKHKKGKPLNFQFKRLNLKSVLVFEQLSFFRHVDFSRPHCRNRLWPGFLPTKRSLQPYSLFFSVAARSFEVDTNFRWRHFQYMPRGSQNPTMYTKSRTHTARTDSTWGR